MRLRVRAEGRGRGVLVTAGALCREALVALVRLVDVAPAVFDAPELGAARLAHEGFLAGGGAADGGGGGGSVTHLTYLKRTDVVLLFVACCW